MNRLESITRKLKAKKSGSGWIACCPAHDDHNPSLAIKETTTGKLLLYCFAGCTYQEIIAALKNLGVWGKYGK